MQNSLKAVKLSGCFVTIKIEKNPPCRHIANKTRTKQVGKRPKASRSLRPQSGRSAVHSRSRIPY